MDSYDPNFSDFSDGDCDFIRIFSAFFSLSSKETNCLRYLCEVTSMLRLAWMVSFFWIVKYAHYASLCCFSTKSLTLFGCILGCLLSTYKLWMVVLRNSWKCLRVHSTSQLKSVEGRRPFLSVFLPWGTVFSCGCWRFPLRGGSSSGE